jgi:ribosome biogenesis GTPase / thiamine phosphate phosphatase
MIDAEVRRARVIAVGRNTVWVVPHDTQEPILAALRKNDKKATLPAPGDIVRIQQIEPDRVVVDAIEPRGATLTRSTPGGRHKTMAANIDTLAIVAALADPPLGFAMIDRLVAFAVQHEIAAALFLTKPDLSSPERIEHIRRIYEPLGVPVLVVQPKIGAGIPDLRAFLTGRHALLVGHSGVGKSTIFRALGGTATVGDLSRFGRGRQTTTSARLFQTEAGFLIDSPGIGEFTLDALAPAAIPKLFVEIDRYAEHCRFADCRHLAEPDCAVREAVTAGAIAPSRYESYREVALAPHLAAF